MGIQRGNIPTRIVQDSLIFFVDASNRYSYPGWGSTWKDLIATSDGALESGAVYDSQYGGVIAFDGTDDLVRVLDNDKFSFTDGAGNDKPYTLGVWVLMEGGVAPDTIDANWLISKQDTNQWEWALYKRLSVDDDFIITSHPLTSNSTLIGRRGGPATSLNTWYYVVSTYNGNESGSGYNLYENGYNNGAFAITSGTYTGMGNGTADVAIGQNIINLKTLNGLIAHVHIYNKELSAKEVLQNYNAMKSRFI